MTNTNKWIRVLGFFHVNPDYAYWYGWAMMTKDLGEIKEMAMTMRATHKLGK
ncbi:MAG: hypothetical protein ACNYWU_12465 [Desulfobacterales bacterium]